MKKEKENPNTGWFPNSRNPNPTMSTTYPIEPDWVGMLPACGTRCGTRGLSLFFRLSL